MSRDSQWNHERMPGLRSFHSGSALTLSLALALSLALGTVVAADEAKSDPPAGAATPDASAPSASAPTTAPAGGDAAAPAKPAAPLKGGVRKIELNLEKLRDVGLDLKRLLTSTKHVFDEVTIQPVSMVTEPEVIGRGTIIYIPVATQAAGPPLPPRKDRLDSAMSIIRPIVTTLKQNVDDFEAGRAELDLPQDVLDELKPQITQWVALVDDVSTQLTKLEPLTQGPSYDNTAIGATATVMQRDVEKLDKTRRSIYKIIRKEGKRIAAAKTQSGGG